MCANDSPFATASSSTSTSTSTIGLNIILEEKCRTRGDVECHWQSTRQNDSIVDSQFASLLQFDATSRCECEGEPRKKIFRNRFGIFLFLVLLLSDSIMMILIAILLNVAMSVSKYSNFHVLGDIHPWTIVLAQNCDIGIRFRTLPRVAHIQQHSSLASEGFVLKTHRVVAPCVTEGNQSSHPFPVGGFRSSPSLEWRGRCERKIRRSRNDSTVIISGIIFSDSIL